MELTINVDETPLKGTLAFVKKLIANTELKIANTKDGALAIFARFPEEEEWELVSRIPPAIPENRLFLRGFTSKNGMFIYQVYPVDEECRHGLFGYPLTPAALGFVDGFIEYCSEKLSEWIADN